MKWLFICAILFSGYYAKSQSIVWTAKCAPVQRETYGVAYSADGTKVLSGSECHPAYIKMWNADSGVEMWSYTVPGSMVMCQMGVKFSSNGSFFASIEETGWLLVFDNTGSNPVNTYTVNIKTSGSYSLDFSPDNSKIVVDALDDTIKVVDVATGNIDKAIYTGHGGVYTVAYSKDGSLLLSGGQDGKVRIWDALSGTLVTTLTGHTSKVISAKFSDDDSRIISADVGGGIIVQNAVTYAEISSFATISGVTQVDLSFDNNYIIAGADTTARLFTADGLELATFNNMGGGKVYSVDFKPQSNTEVVIGNSAGDVSLYSLNNIVNGVHSLEKGKLSCYPNPTADRIWIQTSNSVYSTYAIFSPVGEVVQSGLLESSGIDVSGLPAGIYWLKVKENGIEKCLTIEKQD